MTRHLRDADFEAIVEILDGWTDRLTWELLLDRVEMRLKRRYSRLTLERKPRIVEAFRLAKSRSATKPECRVPSSPEAQVIARLRAENERLTIENHRLLEQHTTWRYNAALKGLTLSDLSRPLPQLDRGRDE